MNTDQQKKVIEAIQLAFDGDLSYDQASAIMLAMLARPSRTMDFAIEAILNWQP